MYKIIFDHNSSEFESIVRMCDVDIAVSSTAEAANKFAERIIEDFAAEECGSEPCTIATRVTARSPCSWLCYDIIVDKVITRTFVCCDDDELNEVIQSYS